MSAFATTFREQVIPSLIPICEREAAPVAWELKAFDDAHATVMREAIRRGAGMLPDSVFHDLDWWISRTILAEVQKHTPAVQAQADASDRAWADVCRWERELARYGCGREDVSALVDGALATLG